MQENIKRRIRMEAARFRDKCKVGRYGIIDLFKECERFGYKLFRVPIGNEAELGFAVKRNKDIIIFTNSSSRLSREIFTLAHEIGHVVLHFEKKTSFTDDNVTIDGNCQDIMEQEANYFAACLLMPEEDLERFLDLEINNFYENGLSAMDIARIMSEFNVSFDMALNRLENLKKIQPDQKATLQTQKMENRVGNLLRSVGGNAKLNLSSNDLNIPYEFIDYVIYNYNHNAVPKETLERVLKYYQLTIEDVSDKIVEHIDDNVDDLEDLIGGLDF